MKLNGCMMGIVAALWLGLMPSARGLAADTLPATTAATGEEAAHAALRALVPIYEQAASAGKPEGLKPYLDPDFTGVMVTGTEVKGLDGLQSYWAQMQKVMGEGATYRVKVHVTDQALLSGDLAVARGTTSESVVLSGGKEFAYEACWTAVCRKREGQWKILRVQASMDPISNPFVAAATRRTGTFSGVAGLCIGLGAGWLVGRMLGRRRVAAGRT